MGWLTEDSISGDILATIYRQMWGIRLGWGLRRLQLNHRMWMIHNLFSNDGESVVEPIVASSLDTSHRYQNVARDDVRVHFEKEGPDMMFMQCSIGDETLREELRNKLEKGRE